MLLSRDVETTKKKGQHSIPSQLNTTGAYRANVDCLSRPQTGTEKTIIINFIRPGRVCCDVRGTKIDLPRRCRIVVVCLSQIELAEPADPRSWLYLVVSTVRCSESNTQGVYLKTDSLSESAPHRSGWHDKRDTEESVLDVKHQIPQVSLEPQSSQAAMSRCSENCSEASCQHEQMSWFKSNRLCTAVIPWDYH
ncbi:hypothetical protein PoB_000280200 [Plakobranchus ocellatus]|uniref:Uncharacterized protein n=1 Tax=Plakobranchus ocellatus TaxID=259542 RepID=A0AAV3Y2D8_9GAST|nr:hypothetical protein PoB_000280200 [Plakobranchus ocellatus]